MPEPRFATVLATPLGPITVVAKMEAITAVVWGEAAGDPCDLLDHAASQLTAYFDRRLTKFDLPLDFGTGFQAKVCRAIAAIPHGRTCTYGDLARDIGAPAQAVGQACGANPVPILIPCHRVLGATSLGGFSARGGVETKVFLLRLEGAAGLLI